MKKLGLIIITFSFLQFSHGQASLKILLDRIDSMTVIVEINEHNRINQVVGGSGLGNFNGALYKSSKINPIVIAELNFDTLGKRTLYVMNKTIIKIRAVDDEFYKINDRYYSNQCKEITNPDLLKEFLTFEEILKNLLILMP